MQEETRSALPERSCTPDALPWGRHCPPAGLHLHGHGELGNKAPPRRHWDDLPACPARQVGGWQLFMGPYALQSVTRGHYAWIILSACLQPFHGWKNWETEKPRAFTSLHFWYTKSDIFTSFSVSLGKIHVGKTALQMYKLVLRDRRSKGTWDGASNSQINSPTPN